MTSEEFDDSRTRSKSAQRLRYEAEITVLKRKLGDLESIRQQLGLSRRKVCQLLMVDPSAWNRWTRPGDDAPPHIYRALQWYLALNDKYPALDVGFWLQTTGQLARPEAFAEKTALTRATTALNQEIQQLKTENAALASRLAVGDKEIQILQKGTRRISARIFWVLLANSVLLAALLLVFATGKA